MKIKVITLLGFHLLFDDHLNFSSSLKVVTNLEQVCIGVLEVYSFLHVLDLLWIDLVCIFPKTMFREKFCSQLSIMEIFVSKNLLFPSFPLIH